MRLGGLLFVVLVAAGCGGANGNAAKTSPSTASPTASSASAAESTGGASVVPTPAAGACAKATGKTEGCSYWAKSGGQKYCFDVPEDACMCQCGKTECSRTEAAVDNTVTCD